MYSEKLEKLIELALVDGVLTDKERQVLMKNAEAEGIDIDEFEMILDARLHERQQTTGVVPVKITSANNADERNTIRALFKQYYSIEDKMRKRLAKDNQAGTTIGNTIKAIGDVAIGAISAYTGGIGGAVVSRILSDDDDDDPNENIETLVHSEKIKFINQFPIPVSRDGFIEFLSNATSLAIPSQGSRDTLSQLWEDKGSKNTLSQLWEDKCKTVIAKARLSLKNDKEALSDVEHYASKVRNLEGARKKKRALYIIIGACLVIALVVGIICGIASDNEKKMIHENKVSQEKLRLELILENVNGLMKEQNYEEAEVLINQLSWEYWDEYSKSDLKKLSSSWDKKRKDILKIIKDKNPEKKGTWNKIKDVFD
jgi:hypothetical protein